MRPAEPEALTSHVFLPINIAKSGSEVIGTEGEGYAEGQTEYAYNVYVPISIERPTEVKVDLEHLGGDGG